MDDAGDIATADGTLGKSFATVRTRDHVTALQQYAVDDRIHAHFTQIVILCVGITCN